MKAKLNKFQYFKKKLAIKFMSICPLIYYWPVLTKLANVLDIILVTPVGWYHYQRRNANIAKLHQNTKKYI